MAFTVRVDPRDSTPLWKQIEESVRRQVASRAAPPGAAMPSVRELARDLRINPATVARAYQRLAEEGILTVRRGEGTFVAEAPPAWVRAERLRLLLEGAVRYANLAAAIGATEVETADELRAAWSRMERAAQGGGE